MQQQVSSILIDTYYIPSIEMSSFVTENLIPILEDGLSDTPSSDPLNLYMLHRGYGTDLAHQGTTTSHPSDYSTFSVGQVVLCLRLLK